MSKTAEQLLEELGNNFNEFKETNDKRLAKIEKSEGISELEEKLGKVNEDLDAKGDKLKELEKVKAANDELKERFDQMEAKGNRPGSDKGDGQSDEYKDAFLSGFMRKGKDEALLELKSGTGYQGSDPDGGYAIPDGMDETILQLLGNQSQMRRLSTVMPVGQARYSQIVSAGNAGAGWVDEVDARPETTNPTLDKFTPMFGELYANPASTQHLLDDGFFDVEAWYNDEISQVFAEKEGEAFVMGTGVNQPKGILSYATAATADNVRPYGTIEEMSSATAGAIEGDDLIDLTYKLRAGYSAGAQFLMARTTVAAVRKLKDNEGRYLWQQSLILGEPSTLAAFPVAEEESMPAVAAGAFAVAFGDFKRAYKILDVRGIRMLRDPYTNKPYVHFYTTKRVGGGVSNTQAIKLLKVQ